MRLRSMLMPAAAIALLIVITLAVYSPARQFALLQWDDQLHLTENTFIQPGDPERYSHFWHEPYAKLYVPVTYNVWAAIYANCFDTSGHFSAALLHGANLIAHALAVVLVFALLDRLLVAAKRECSRTQMIIASFAGAMLFALHPLQVEAVAWISELRGLLAADFALAAMLVYVVGVAADRRAMRIACAIVGPMLMALAVLSKPSVAMLPAMLFVIDRCWIGRPTKRVISSLLPWLAIAVAQLVLMRSLQTGGGIDVALWRRPFVAGDAIAFYLGRLLWPFALSADYSRSPMFAAQMMWFWLAWIVPAAIGVALAWKRSPAAIVGIGLFIAALLPVLGLVPFEFQRLSTVADRYAYLALLGPAFLIAIAVARRPRIATPIVTVALCLLVWRTSDQLRCWRDDISLWQHAADVNPRAIVARCNLAAAAATRGERTLAHSLFSDVLTIAPQSDLAHFGLGSLAADAGDVTGAITFYRQSAELNPNDTSSIASGHDGAGLMLARLGRRDEAIAEFRLALAAEPDFTLGWNDLGAALLEAGKSGEARDAFERSLSIAPRAALPLLNLATAQERLNDIAGANATLKRAATFLPRDARPAKRLADRAQADHRWADAISWWDRVVAIDPNDVDAFNERGQALAFAGRYDDAITSFERAIALRPDLSELRDNLAAVKAMKR